MIHEQTQFNAAQSVEMVQKEWAGATLPQRMVLAGGLVGVLSFFLPWQSVAFFFAQARGSGFTLARMGYVALWTYPLLMGAAVFLTWRTLHSSPAAQAKSAVWSLAVGSGWTFFWVVGVMLRGDTSMLWGGGISLLACLAVWVGSAKLIGSALVDAR